MPKWKELQHSKNLSLKVTGLESELKTRTEDLSDANNQLFKSKADIERLTDYVAELENFKRKEVDKVTCRYCKNTYDTIYKLGSHKGICQHNPKKGLNNRS